MNSNEPEKVGAKPEQPGLTAKDSSERYGAHAWDEGKAADELLRGFADFYNAHKPVEWKPIVSSRGISQLTLPVLIPCKPDKADGRIYYQAYPQRIAELPVRQLNPRELLKVESPLWNAHLWQTVELVSAIEADKGIVKVIREQLGEDGEFERQTRQHPWSYAASLLNSGLYSLNAPMRLAVWWRDSEKKLDMGLYCPDRRTAAYALLLSRGKNVVQFGVCPQCEGKFQKDEWHPNIYCSAKCRNAAAQAAFRDRRKAEKGRRRKRNRRVRAA